MVVDVTVRFEDAVDTLPMAAKEKVRHYICLKSTVANSFNARSVWVFGFPVGARGLWPASNEEILTALGLSSARRKTFSRLVSRRTLLYSLDVLRSFYRDLPLK